MRYKRKTKQNRKYKKNICSLPIDSGLFESNRHHLPAAGTNFITSFCFLGTQMYAFDLLQLLHGILMAHGTVRLSFSDVLSLCGMSRRPKCICRVKVAPRPILSGCAKNPIASLLSWNMKSLML